MFRNEFMQLNSCLQKVKASHQQKILEKKENDERHRKLHKTYSCCNADRERLRAKESEEQLRGEVKKLRQMLITYDENISCIRFCSNASGDVLQPEEADKQSRALVDRIKQLNSLLKEERASHEQEILRAKENEERLREELQRFVLPREQEKLRTKESEEQLTQELQKLRQMLIIYQEHTGCRSLLMKNANKYMETVDTYVEFSELETDKLGKELLSKMEQLSSLLRRDRTSLEQEILRVKEDEGRLREELKQYVLQHELEKLRAKEREEQLRGELQRLRQMLIIDNDNVILLRQELQKIKEKYQIIDEHFTHLWTASNTMEPAQTVNSQGDVDSVLKATKAIEAEGPALKCWTDAEDGENIFELVAQAIRIEDTSLKYPSRNSKEDLENNIYAIVAKAIQTEGTLLQCPSDLEKLVEVTEHLKNETKKIATCMKILHHTKTPVVGTGLPITAEFQIPNSLSLEKQVNGEAMETEEMLSGPEFEPSQVCYDESKLQPQVPESRSSWWTWFRRRTR